MARLNVDYDLLTWEGDILRLKFWATAFDLLRESGTMFKQTEGKLAGCWVMPIDEEAGEAASSSIAAPTSPPMQHSASATARPPSLQSCALLRSRDLMSARTASWDFSPHTLGLLAGHGDPDGLLAGADESDWDAARQLAGDLRWEVRSAGSGSKGERWYAWAWLATASPRHCLLIRRHLTTGELAFHYCHVPEGQLLTKARLIRAAGLRWPVEEDFELGKDCFGLDQCQARLYTAILRHIVLVMAALAICSVTAALLRRRFGGLQQRCGLALSLRGVRRPDARCETETRVVGDANGFLG